MSQCGLVPSWAGRFDARRFERFSALVEADLRRSGRGFEQRGPVIEIRLPERSVLRLNITSLAQTCASEPDGSWPALIRRYMREAADTDRLVEETERITRSPERALRLMRARVQPSAQYPEHVRTALLVRPVAPGIDEALVYDLPTQIINVPERHARWIGRSNDDLFALGRASLRAAAEPRWRRRTLAPGLSLFDLALPEAPLFTASHLLLIDRYLPPTPYGALIAAPLQSELVFHPITGTRSLGVLGQMALRSLASYREGPGALCPDLLWAYRGALRALPFSIAPDGAVSISDRLFAERVLEPLRRGPIDQ